MLELKLKQIKLLLLTVLLLLNFTVLTSQNKVTKTDKLNWWRDARFGMFIHWGPASLTGQEISWSRANYGVTKYDSLYLRFNPIKFNAQEWIQIAKSSGVKYIVCVMKHHDGFCLWNTQTTPHNIMNTPFGRDVAKELTDAAKEANMPFCFYFSPGDWKDPDCRNPQTNDAFVERMNRQITELLTNYGKIPLVWIDYDGRPNPAYPKQTYELINNLQNDVLINNRLEALHPDESHGFIGEWGDYATPEQFVGSFCNSAPWETCITLGKGWTCINNDEPKSLKWALSTLANTIGGDGNLLLNVGPQPTGEILPEFRLRLKEIGTWINRHAEAVYGTRGGPFVATNTFATTRKENAIYVYATNLEKCDTVFLPALLLKIKAATTLSGKRIQFQQSRNGIQLIISKQLQDTAVSVVKLSFDKSVMDIAPIYPPSTTNSLAYNMPSSASSSVAPAFMHNSQAAFDNNETTFWSTGRNQEGADAIIGKKFDSQHWPDSKLWARGGWLAVDFGKPQLVKYVVVKEYISAKPWRPYSPITSFSIEYLHKGMWLNAASGAVIGKNKEIEFKNPIKARQFRIKFDALGRAAIAEFQLFAAQKNDTISQFQNKQSNITIIRETVKTVDSINIDIEVMMPSKKGKFPVLFYVHGGGWDHGTAKVTPGSQNLSSADLLCDALGVVFVGVDYRCKNQNGDFDKALQDVMDVYNYAYKNAKRFKCDFRKVGFSGGSAGTPLSAVASQKIEACKILPPLCLFMAMPTPPLVTNKVLLLPIPLCKKEA